jgi:uncharacterized protein (DUF58 family)
MLRPGTDMLITIAIISCLLWALGLFTSYMMGGLIHILLIVALVALMARLVQDRRMINENRR